MEPTHYHIISTEMAVSQALYDGDKHQDQLYGTDITKAYFV